MPPPANEHATVDFSGIHVTPIVMDGLGQFESLQGLADDHRVWHGFHIQIEQFRGPTVGGDQHVMGTDFAVKGFQGPLAVVSRQVHNLVSCQKRNLGTLELASHRGGQLGCIQVALKGACDGSFESGQAHILT